METAPVALSSSWGCVQLCSLTEILSCCVREAPFPRAAVQQVNLQPHVWSPNLGVLTRNQPSKRYPGAQHLAVGECLA